LSKKDKNDNKIIESAVERKAEFIISGDNHLLVIKNIRKSVSFPRQILFHL